MITVRRIKTGETDLYKQLRLASLREAPYAFSTTYQAALQRPAEAWCKHAEGSTQGSDRATFIAFAEDVPVGLAVLVRLPDQSADGELLQVWVAPEQRGTGAARALIDGVFQWAAENNFRRIIAGVTRENTGARKFYTNYGFVVITETSANISEGVYLVKEVQQ